MNLNFSPPPFPRDQISINDHDHQHNFALNHQVVSSSSSSSPSSHIFFNSTQDHTGYYHHQLYQPHSQEDEKYAYHGGSSFEMIKSTVNSGLKLTLRQKKEGQGPAAQSQKDINPVKWMSSKIRLTQRKKNKNPNFPASKAKLEDDHQKVQPSSSLETDLSSNTSSYNSNNPIRVCADCNTTKTPLWRSGPKGPKSLCNACGIRQRKARRAMGAATAAAKGTAVAFDQPPPVKIKAKHKEKKGQNGHSSQFKKRCKMAVSSAAGSSSSSSGATKLGFEEFLINLSNNLALHRVFPEDEKDAAILLMALSSGLVHG